MESWRKVWRDGLAPLLSDEALRGLRDALRDDDPRLLQGATTTPPPLRCVQDWPVEAACALGFCGAVDGHGEHLGFHDGGKNADACTVAEVEEFFAKACFDCDQRMGESASCRWFLNWFDETPRDEMRLALLPEVERSLAMRKVEARDCDGGVERVPAAG